MKNVLLRLAMTTILTLPLLPIVVAGGVSNAGPESQTATPRATPSKPILLTDPVPDPHQEGVIYFSQTGHTLRGKFLSYWQQNGGLAQFGYPLTEAFFEPDGAGNAPLQVQYFERARFELHPENQPPSDVLLGALGREFHPQDPSAAQQPAPSLYFPQTMHNLSGVFLQYWQTHGGLAVNGYPITEPQSETSTDGKEYLTQWFERSRFELHPENAGSPYEVLLGQLGRQLSEKRGYPFGRYPLFGRATDYSWVAGRMDLREPFAVEAAGGCAVLRYDQSDTRGEVQLDGPGWAPYIWQAGPQPAPREGDYLVVFGHRPRTNEVWHGCDFSHAPGYLLDKLQANPAQ